MKRWGKLLVVIVGAVIITALGIDAADTLTGSEGTMLAQLVKTENGCPKGMVPVPTATTFSCVDRFEAGANQACPHPVPTNANQTRANLNVEQCAATSEVNTTPWRNISREQAATACAKTSKRLPTAHEWYQFAIGTTQNECIVDTNSVAANDGASLCQSSFGVINTVGNVWEWVSDDVFDQEFNGRVLPAEGYVTQVDSGGVPTVTAEDVEDEDFGEDYFWSKPQGAFGMIRGGFYDSQSDAGVYAIHAHTLPTMQVDGIGFRCVL